MRGWLPIAINVAAFHVLWTAAMFGAGKPWWWVAPALILLSLAGQLRLSPRPIREGVLILAGACVGVSADWLASSLGLFRYVGQSPVEFLTLFGALWVNFGTTLRPSFRWMWRRPVLAAVSGAIGGPGAYWVGSRIGAITLAGPEWRGLVWVATQYAAALPLWMLAANRMLGEPGAADPRHCSHGATP